MSLGAYPNFEQLRERIRGVQNASCKEVGQSHEGRSIDALVFGEQNQGPSVMVFANIHGIEFISSQCALYFAEHFADALCREGPVVIVPCLNPDGYARTVSQQGKGSVRSMRTNARGVDLNRNFPPPKGESYTKWPFGGSNDKSSATFRGESPASENETRVALELGAYYKPVGVCSLHSFMGTLITPRVPDKSTYKDYQGLCRAFQNAQPQKRYHRFASRFIDGFTGELEDHFHHTLGAWSVCVESFWLSASFAQHVRAPSTFWRFNPQDISKFTQNDAPGIDAFLRMARKTPHPKR